jgi:hypothetical protein
MVNNRKTRKGLNSEIFKLFVGSSWPKILHILMGEDRIESFEKLTKRMENLLSDGFVHDQLLSVSYDRKKKDYLVKVKGC